eukprot:scaffold3644_cov107-Isochrysis_galbana.AAC.13
MSHDLRADGSLFPLGRSGRRAARLGEALLLLRRGLDELGVALRNLEPERLRGGRRGGRVECQGGTSAPGRVPPPMPVPASERIAFGAREKGGEGNGLEPARARAPHRGGATTGESHTEGEWGGERRRGGSASDARGSSMTRCTRKGGVHFPAAAVRLDASVRGAKERHHMSPVHLFFWSSLSDSLRATCRGSGRTAPGIEKQDAGPVGNLAVPVGLGGPTVGGGPRIRRGRGGATAAAAMMGSEGRMEYGKATHEAARKRCADARCSGGGRWKEEEGGCASV